MPKVSDVYKSTILRASDLNGETLAYALGGYREEVVYGNTANVIDVEVEGTRRVLKLGTMLANDIAAAVGDEEINNWLGRAMTLYPYKQKIRESNGEGTKVEKFVDMIRAKAAPEGTPVRVAVPSIRQTLNDDIPF
jgi:hypothetical protein